MAMMREIMDIVQGRGNKAEQQDVMRDLVYGILLALFTAAAAKLAATLTERILGNRD